MNKVRKDKEIYEIQDKVNGLNYLLQLKALNGIGINDSSVVQQIVKKIHGDEIGEVKQEGKKKTIKVKYYSRVKRFLDELKKPLRIDMGEGKKFNMTLINGGELYNLEYDNLIAFIKSMFNYYFFAPYKPEDERYIKKHESFEKIIKKWLDFKLTNHNQMHIEESIAEAIVTVESCVLVWGGNENRLTKKIDESLRDFCQKWSKIIEKNKIEEGNPFI